MNILFTGNLPLVSNDFFSAIGEEYRCVTYCEKEKLKFEGKNVLTYSRNEEKDELSHVFTAFGFETVVYFSYMLEGNKNPFEELEQLEKVLHQCSKNQVKRFLYITGNHLPSQEKESVEEKSYLILKEACDALCHYISEQEAISVTILKVPYLYGKKLNRNDFLNEVLQKGKLSFPGKKEFQTDFLCDEDLGELIGRMLDEPCPEMFAILHLSGDNPVTFEELGEQIRSYLPELEVSYGTEYDYIPRYRKGKRPRTEYGWYPKNRFEDILEEAIKRGFEEKNQKRKKQQASYERRKNHKKWKEKARVFLEILILFVVTEFLNDWTKGNVMVNFIDFRLIYVVIMGTMNGLNAGILAAALSCVGYHLVNATDTPWQVLFYNVQNWLPFACYFLLGAISGYTRDKHDDEVLYAKEEYDIMEDKYVFLSSLYREVLAGKEEFNHQIIGYRDSYGKMYSIVKKLDSTLPEEVFYEAVSILEDMLENNYVAIYSIDEQSDFARLNVCSKNCNQLVGKSMKTTNYPVVMEKLRANEVFENKQALEGYPAYATPIFRNEELVGMILLMKVNTRQMNMEFSNKFRIVTNLIRDSLIRAMDYYDRSDAILDGTRILSTESFQKVLEVKRQMKQKQYLEFMLLKIEMQGMSTQEISEKVGSTVRNNDTLGLGEDGNLYLLLCQTGQEDLKVVAERLQKKQIAFEVVKD